MGYLVSILTQGRQAANARMTETLHAYTEVPDVNTTNFDNDPIQTTVYDGPGRVKYPFARVIEKVQGTQAVAEQLPEVHFPSGTPGIIKDVIIMVTASTADSGVVGRKFRARGAGLAGQTTALRVPVDELS